MVYFVDWNFQGRVQVKRDLVDSLGTQHRFKQEKKKHNKKTLKMVL